jgi:hypothetical protein
LSDATSEVIETVREVAVAGIVKAVIVGAAVSLAGGSVIVVDELSELETFPAASLAHA